MAPTKDIIITIPTLEGMFAALMLFHYAIVDFAVGYTILVGCALILLSFFTKHAFILLSLFTQFAFALFFLCTKQLSNFRVISCIIDDCYKTSDPSPDFEQNEGSGQDEDDTSSNHTSGSIEYFDYLRWDESKEERLGYLRRVVSWALFVGGIFIMIPTD